MMIMILNLNDGEVRVRRNFISISHDIHLYVTLLIMIDHGWSRIGISLWTTEPNRVVKFKKIFFFLFLAKNHYNYMGEGHFRPEQVGTSHFRAPMGPKTAKNGHFGQFWGP